MSRPIDSMGATGRKRKRWNGPIATKNRENLPPRKRENSSAKKYTTSANANTARGRHSKPSLSVFQKHAGQASNSARPNRAALLQKSGSKRNATWLKAVRVAGAHRAPAHVPPRTH